MAFLRLALETVSRYQADTPGHAAEQLDGVSLLTQLWADDPIRHTAVLTGLLVVCALLLTAVALTRSTPPMMIALLVTGIAIAGDIGYFYASSEAAQTTAKVDEPEGARIPVSVHEKTKTGGRLRVQISHKMDDTTAFQQTLGNEVSFPGLAFGPHSNAQSDHAYLRFPWRSRRGRASKRPTWS